MERLNTSRPLSERPYEYGRRLIEVFEDTGDVGYAETCAEAPEVSETWHEALGVDPDALLEDLGDGSIVRPTSCWSTRSARSGAGAVTSRTSPSCSMPGCGHCARAWAHTTGPRPIMAGAPAWT